MVISFGSFATMVCPQCGTPVDEIVPDSQLCPDCDDRRRVIREQDEKRNGYDTCEKCGRYGLIWDRGLCPQCQPKYGRCAYCNWTGELADTRLGLCKTCQRFWAKTTNRLGFKRGTILPPDAVGKCRSCSKLAVLWSGKCPSCTANEMNYTSKPCLYCGRLVRARIGSGSAICSACEKAQRERKRSTSSSLDGEAPTPRGPGLDSYIVVSPDNKILGRFDSQQDASRASVEWSKKLGRGVRVELRDKTGPEWKDKTGNVVIGAQEVRCPDCGVLLVVPEGKARICDCGAVVNNIDAPAPTKLERTGPKLSATQRRFRNLSTRIKPQVSETETTDKGEDE